jgi:hypothetical protein
LDDGGDESKSSKTQPSKSQINPNRQISKLTGRVCQFIGTRPYQTSDTKSLIWSLEFPWDLELVIWSFQF